ncbi:class I SAM-dependent methyltransferase [Cupriavidus basilensis]
MRLDPCSGDFAASCPKDMASCPGASPSLQDGLASKSADASAARAALDALVARVRAEAVELSDLGAAPDPLSVDFLRLPEPVLPESGTRCAGGMVHRDHLLAIPSSDFIGEAYRLLLGREPDERGLAEYGELLGLAGSSLWVAVQLRYSAEGRRRAVRMVGMRGVVLRYLAARVAGKLGLGEAGRRWFARYEQRTLDQTAFTLGLADALQRQREGVLRLLRGWRKPIEAIAGSVPETVRSQRGAEQRIAELEDKVERLLNEQANDRLARRSEQRDAEGQSSRAVPAGGSSGLDGDARLRRSDLQSQIESYYMAFEDANRGSRAEILRKLAPYEDWIAAVREQALGPVLDVGCGRGEWLELLGARGVPARGVDLNGAMVELCRGHGLEAERTDAVAALAQVEDGTLGAVTAFHIVEHLPFEALYELIANAARALAPGGSILIETPNPENLLVGSHTFYHDFSHRNPVTPTSLSFLLAFHGLEQMQVLRLNPYPGAAKVPGDDPLTERVNGHLCGPQDYAVIARRPLAVAALPGAAAAGMAEAEKAPGSPT